MTKKLMLLAASSLALSFIFPGQALASPLFSPYADVTINTYWDSKYQDMEPMNLSQISKESSIADYHLAFITDAGKCIPAWGGQTSFSIAKQWAKHLTATLQKEHIGFVISLGGANGTDISANCTPQQLEDAYEKIITTYQPRGLDFDIENGTANVPKVMAALAQIQKHYPNLNISFTLPVLPEGLTTTGKDILVQAKQANINFKINIMAMDYGPAYSGNMGQYAMQAAENLLIFLKTLYPRQTDALLWQMIEVTPMIGVNDVNSEAFSLNDADTLRDFALQKNIYALSMWSIARDKPCADKWASPICSGNNLQSQPYEFSKRFLNN